MRRSWQRGVVAVTVAMVGLVAAGCGSSTTESGSGGSSTTAPAASGTSSTTTPDDEAMGPVDIVVVSTPYGDALGTDDGLVLYAWDTEADGTIACLDAECVEKWPPLTATEVGDVGDLDPARFTLVDRPDGTTQVALDARPLYHMAVDEPGEATCQGAEGWWILNPDGTKNTNETPRTVPSSVPGY